MIKQLIERLEEVKGSVETTINTNTMTVHSHYHLAPGISEAIKIAKQLQEKVKCGNCKYYEQYEDRLTKDADYGFCSKHIGQLLNNSYVTKNFTCKFWEEKE